MYSRTHLQSPANLLARLIALQLCIFVLVVLSSTTVHAYSQLFDWSAEGWTPPGPGSLPRTYTNVGGTGIDVVVNVDPTDDFTDGTPSEDGNNGLENHLNWEDITESTTFTFSFYETGTTTPAGVYVSDLTAKDLDAPGAAEALQDAVIFSAIPFGGGYPISPDQIQLYPNTNLVIQDRQTVYSQLGGDTGVGDPEGWATAGYQSRLIQSFSLEYHNGPDLAPGLNPSEQWMWISDFFFSGPDLSVSKTNDATGSVVPGQTINYTVTITNESDGLQTGIVVGDVLSPGTTYDAQSTEAIGYRLTGYTNVASHDFTGGNSGGTGWAGDWVERPPSNDTAIENPGNPDPGLRIRDNNRGIERAVDLSGLSAAVLSFDYRRIGVEAGKDIRVYAVGSATDCNAVNIGSWTELGSIPGTGTDDTTWQIFSVELPLALLAADARICLRTPGWPGQNNTDVYRFDNILIAEPTLESVTMDNIPLGLNPDLDDGIPPNLVTAADSFGLLPGQSMSVTYSATVNNPTDALATFNAVAVTSAQVAFPRLDHTVNAVTHTCPGVVGGTLPIIQGRDDGYWQKGTDPKFSDDEYRLGAQVQDGDWAGLRFQNISIPKGARIDEVFITIVSNSYDANQPARTDIYAHDVTSAPEFSGSVPANRTDATVEWDFGTWEETTSYTSPNLASIVQELVDDSADGLNNAAVAFLFESLEENERKGCAFESDKDNCAPASIEISWSCPVDRGDALAPVGGYGDPQHYNLTPGQLFIGGTGDEPDSESITQATSAADGDDNDGNDDENGVTFRWPLSGGANIFADVAVNNSTGITGYVCGWLDVDEDGIFGTAERQCTTTTITEIISFEWTGLPVDIEHTTYARFRIGPLLDLLDQTNIESPTNIVLGGEVEDYMVVYNFNPVAVSIGKVELHASPVEDFLIGLGAGQMDRTALLAILKGWDPLLAASLANADYQTIMEALYGYLDPDGDGQVAVLFWDTLEERGTIGFYVHRREGESGDWIRINNDMLPGLLTAPMGGEYLLADPAARSGTRYQYHLIEQEASGNTRSYGPFSVEMSK